MTEQELCQKFNIAMQYSSAVPPAGKAPKLATAAVKAMENGGHLFLGEPHFNGNTLKTYEMLADNAEIFDASAKTGARHLVLEFPAYFQKVIDAYAEKVIDRDGLECGLFKNDDYRYVPLWLTGDAEAQYQQSFMQVLDHALAAGLRVHFADVTAQTSIAPTPPKEFQELDAKLAAQYQSEKPSVSFPEYIAAYLTALSAEERNKLLDMYNEMGVNQRRARMDDTEQYNYLRARFPAGESVIGVFGLAHLDDSVGQHKGLNFWLEQEGAKVTCIEIYDGANSRSFLEEEYRLMGLAKRKQPDFTFMIDGAELQAGGGGKPVPGKPGGPALH